MTPLPAALGGRELIVWRLDEARFRPSWDSGEGAYIYGGRWSSRGVRAVYCSIDPATAILEVAAHKRFRLLDTIPYVLTGLEIIDAGSTRVVYPDEIPNPNWIRPGMPSGGQQEFGDELLARHMFVVIPSAVSTESWNLIFAPAVAKGAYAVRSQERFALDTRLHPPRA